MGSKREGVNIEAPTSISLSQGLKLARHGVGSVEGLIVIYWKLI